MISAFFMFATAAFFAAIIVNIVDSVSVSRDFA
jgi:hypothetical protein